MLGELFPSLFYGFLQFIVGTLAAIGAIYLALKMSERYRKDISDLHQVRAGNIAVGIRLAAFVFTISVLVRQGVLNLTSMVAPGQNLAELQFSFLIGVAALLLWVFFAVLCIILAMYIFDVIVGKEYKVDFIAQGNVSAAILLTGVLFGITYVIQAALERMLAAADIAKILLMLGVS